MAIKLIIGLRNPGANYEHTRHNAGGWFVKALAQHYHAAFKVEKKLHAELADCLINQATTRLALPQVFMNHSGQPTVEVSQFYRINSEEILIVHDEIDFPVGHIKIKTGGGHGGHNGLRDIIKQLGNGDFHRLRIGIGHPGHKELVVNYVLGKPSLQDKKLIYQAIDEAITVIPALVAGNISEAMNQLNS